MRLSIVLFTFVTSLFITSCSNLFPEAKKPLEPNLEDNDYQVRFVNGLKPIKLKYGNIICPNNTSLQFIGDTKKAAYCYSKSATIEAKNINTVLICEGTISIFDENSGVCEKTN